MWWLRLNALFLLLAMISADTTQDVDVQCAGNIGSFADRLTEKNSPELLDEHLDHVRKPRNLVTRIVRLGNVVKHVIGKFSRATHNHHGQGMSKLRHSTFKRKSHVRTFSKPHLKIRNVPVMKSKSKHNHKSKAERSRKLDKQKENFKEEKKDPEPQPQPKPQPKKDKDSKPTKSPGGPYIKKPKPPFVIPPRVPLGEGI